MAPLTIKASFNDDMRRFTLEEPSLVELGRRTMSVFSIDPRFALTIKHTDEAEVTHTITHTDQLRLLVAHLGNRPFKVTVEAFVPTAAPAASSADDALPPHPGASPNVDFDKKSSSSSPRTPGNEVDDLAYFANEFHYHRLIVQTAVQETFRSVGRTMSKTFEPEGKMDNFVENSNKRLKAVRDAIKEAFADVRSKVPSSSEIAARVAVALAELREYSSSTIDSIREYIERAIQRLLTSRLNRITDGNINEVVDQVIEDIQLQHAEVSTDQLPTATEESHDSGEPRATDQEMTKSSSSMFASAMESATPEPTAEQTTEQTTEQTAEQTTEPVATEEAPIAYPDVPAGPPSPRAASVMSFASSFSMTALEEKRAMAADHPTYQEAAFPVDPTEAALIDQAQREEGATALQSPSAMSFESLSASQSEDEDFIHVDVNELYAAQMDTLKSMGFDDVEKNASLLELYRGSVDDVVQSLLHSSRAV